MGNVSVSPHTTHADVLNELLRALVPVTARSAIVRGAVQVAQQKAALIVTPEDRTEARVGHVQAQLTEALDMLRRIPKAPAGPAVNPRLENERRLRAALESACGSMESARMAFRRCDQWEASEAMKRARQRAVGVLRRDRDARLAAVPLAAIGKMFADDMLSGAPIFSMGIDPARPVGYATHRARRGHHVQVRIGEPPFDPPKL